MSKGQRRTNPGRNDRRITDNRVGVAAKPSEDTGSQLLRLLAQLAGFGLDACAPTLLTEEGAAH